VGFHRREAWFENMRTLRSRRGEHRSSGTPSRHETLLVSRERVRDRQASVLHAGDCAGPQGYGSFFKPGGLSQGAALLRARFITNVAPRPRNLSFALVCIRQVRNLVLQVPDRSLGAA